MYGDVKETLDDRPDLRAKDPFAEEPLGAAPTGPSRSAFVTFRLGSSTATAHYCSCLALREVEAQEEPAHPEKVETRSICTTSTR